MGRWSRGPEALLSEWRRGKILQYQKIRSRDLWGLIMQHPRIRQIVGVLVFLSSICGLSPQRGWAQQGLEQSHRKALLIGNSEYTSISPLKSPPQDVRTLHKILSEQGYQVTMIEELKRDQLEDTVLRYSESLRAQDEVFFYYGGHGLEIDGEGILLGTDFDARDQRQALIQGYPLERLVLMLGNAKSAVMIVDVTQSTSFARRGFQSRSSRSTGLPSMESLSRVASSVGVTIVLPKSGEVAAEGIMARSPFVTAFSDTFVAHGHKDLIDYFNTDVQRRLNHFGQQLMMINMGDIPPIKLNIEMICPEACRPSCNPRCIQLVRER